MFPVLGLLQNLECNNKLSCKSGHCIFTHKSLQSPPPTKPSTSKSTITTTQSVRKATKRTSDPIPVQPAKRRVIKQSVTIPQTLPNGTPRIQASASHSRIPVQDRQRSLTALYEQFIKMYAKLPEHKKLAMNDAFKQEEEIYESAHKNTYKSATANILIKLKRRSPITDINSPLIGTENTLRKRLEEAERAHSYQLNRKTLEKYIPSHDLLKGYGYVVDIPETEGGSETSAIGQMKDCARCNQKFIVEDNVLKDDCTFHDGRPITSKVDGRRARIMSCCSTQMGSTGCCTGPHVFVEKDPGELHKRAAFVHTPEKSSLEVVTLDCEMSFTTAGMSLTRLTVVGAEAELLLDEIVRPASKMIDPNTRFSGVTTHQIENQAVFDLDGIRSCLFQIGVGKDTIIVGHGLENDLNALRIIHHNILDTAILFPHPAGMPFRNSLRNLAADVLKKFIQDATPQKKGDNLPVATHSSYEDALTTLELLRHFVKSK